MSASAMTTRDLVGSGALLVGVVALIAAVVSQTPSSNLGSTPPGRAKATPLSPGEFAYEQYCASCHKAGGPGAIMLGKRVAEGQSAVLDQRTDLDPAYVAAVVRQGIGIMPRFSRIEIPDDQLNTLSRYVARKSPRPTQ